MSNETNIILNDDKKVVIYCLSSKWEPISLRKYRTVLRRYSQLGGPFYRLLYSESIDDVIVKTYHL